MTDLDQRDDSFEALLRSAAFRLRDDLARAQVPPLRRRHRSHRRRWIVAVVATAAVVAGLVAIGTTRKDQSLGNDPQRLHWLINDLPNELSLVAMLDPVSQSGTVDPPVSFNLYATAAAPLGPILSVRGSMGMPNLDLVPAQGGTNISELTIDGRRAAFADGPSGQRLVYIETGTHWILLASRNLDDAALKVLAASAVRTDDGNASIPATGLVAGLTLVLSADTSYSVMLGGPNVTGADYAAPDGRSVSLRVSVPRPAAPAIVGLEAGLKPAKVHGVSGLVGTYAWSAGTGQHEATVVWWQRGGLDFVVRGTDVGEAVVVKAAASVVAASDAKWAELLRTTGYGAVPAAAGTVPAESAPPGTTPPFTGQPVDVTIDVVVSSPSTNEQIGSGVLPTGEAWKVLVTRVYDSMTMSEELNGLPVNGFWSGPVARPAGQEVSCCPANVLTTDPKAVAFRVLRSNGDRYTIPLHDLPGAGGIRAAFISLPGGGAPQKAELLDAAGAVLQSMPTG
ncbi:MAG: hypothetical protein QOE00_2623 [Ilumatobacteraceae bacterium]